MTVAPTVRQTIDNAISERRQAKYHNRKVEWDGEWFDSVAERDEYIFLLARQQQGEITCLMRQDRYCLQDGFTDGSGKRHRGIYVVWDFVYEEGGQLVCQDTKGFPTRAFQIKEKLFRRQYPGIKLIISYTRSHRARRG